VNWCASGLGRFGVSVLDVRLADGETKSLVGNPSLGSPGKWIIKRTVQGVKQLAREYAASSDNSDCFGGLRERWRMRRRPWQGGGRRGSEAGGGGVMVDFNECLSRSAEYQPSCQRLFITPTRIHHKVVQCVSFGSGAGHPAPESTK